MRRDLKCAACGKPLTGNLDTFGDVGRELCLDCYAEFAAETEADARAEEANRKRCPNCDALMNENTFEPGLYHCVECKHWWDLIHNQGWTFHPEVVDVKT